MTNWPIPVLQSGIKKLKNIFFEQIISNKYFPRMLLKNWRIELELNPSPFYCVQCRAERVKFHLILEISPEKQRNDQTLGTKDVEIAKALTNSFLSIISILAI